MKKTKLGVALTTLLLSTQLLGACGGGGGEANDAQKQKQKVCEAMKDLFRFCYDQSSPDVSCPQLSAQVKQEFSKEVSDGEMLGHFENLCNTACDARHQGASWTALNENIDCAKFAQNE